MLDKLSRASFTNLKLVCRDESKSVKIFSHEQIGPSKHFHVHLCKQLLREF